MFRNFYLLDLLLSIATKLNNFANYCNVQYTGILFCRFCTEDEMFEALKVVAGNAVATGVLVEHLEKFLGHYCRERSILLH